MTVVRLHPAPPAGLSPAFTSKDGRPATHPRGGHYLRSRGGPRVARRDNHQAARALADAVLTSDRTAAGKHKITTRTLRRYREALHDDPELSATFRTALDQLLTKSWADELDAGLQEIIRQLRTRTETLPKSVDGYIAIVEAAKALGEIAVAREVLSAAADPDAATEAPSNHAQAANLPN